MLLTKHFNASNVESPAIINHFAPYEQSKQDQRVILTVKLEAVTYTRSTKA